MKKLIKNIRGIISLSEGNIPRKGNDLKKLGIVEDSDILIESDKILSIEKSNLYTQSDVDLVIDADNSWIMPGLIDSHTHPIFAGCRYLEFYQRANGISYQEIANKGGGILSTVEETRKLSAAELKIITENNLKTFIESGTTTIEAKSGYGLTLEDEFKLLEVLKDLSLSSDMSIYRTFLGAHSIPNEFKGNPNSYVDFICNKMIPKVSEKKLASFVDVFCEKGAFNLTQTEKIASIAVKHNLKLRMHLEQLTHMNSVDIALKYNASSIDHAVMVSSEDIDKISRSKTTVVLLPGTEVFLDQNKFAPARQMIDRGCIVALATDFNPGSCTISSLWLISTFSVLKLKMDFSEIVNAITVNPAYSLGISDKYGIISPKYKADLLFLDVSDPIEIPYKFGINPVKMVMKNGRIISKRY